MTKKTEKTTEFVFTDACIEDAKRYRRKGLLSEQAWDWIVYKAKLEAECYESFSRFHRSEKMEGFEKHHIRKVRVGHWRLLFLVRGNVNVFYGLALWVRKDAYKKHGSEMLLQRVKAIAYNCSI